MRRYEAPDPGNHGTGAESFGPHFCREHFRSVKIDEREGSRRAQFANTGQDGHTEVMMDEVVRNEASSDTGDAADQLTCDQNGFPAISIHGEHCQQVSRGFNQDSEDSVDENVTIQVDTVHGQSVIAKIYDGPVDVVNLNKVFFRGLAC